VTCIGFKFWKIIKTGGGVKAVLNIGGQIDFFLRMTNFFD